MTDYFALLQEQRRPWIDADGLKQKFLELSNRVHPDRAHAESGATREKAERNFAELNSAYRILADPRNRLRHFLELELGARPREVEKAPALLVDAFFEVGKLCDEARALLAEKTATTSPLLQVGLFERAQALVERIADTRAKLVGQREGLLEELRTASASWSAAAAEKSVIERLQEINRMLGFLDRWIAQLDEYRQQLSF